MSGFNIYHTQNYGRIMRTVTQMPIYQARPGELAMNLKTRKRKMRTAAAGELATQWKSCKKIWTCAKNAKKSGAKPRKKLTTAEESMRQQYSDCMNLADIQNAKAKLDAEAQPNTGHSQEDSNTPAHSSKPPVPPPSVVAARILVGVNFNSQITQAYGVPVMGNSKDNRQVYWSGPGNQPDTGPTAWATTARQNAIKLLVDLMEDQPTQYFAVVPADAGVIEKRVDIYDTEDNKLVHYPWITSRSSLKELRRKNGSTERYVVLPLLPPNKNLAAHITIMNDKTGVKRSGRAAPTRKQWHTEPWEGWTITPTRDDRKQAYAEAFQLAQLVSTGVQPEIASKKRACPNWQKDPHCLQHAVLAHLCRACLGKQHFDVARSTKSGLGVFMTGLDSREVNARETLFPYVVSLDYRYNAADWHKEMGKSVTHHAIDFKGKGKNAMVIDGQRLESGLGARLNLADTPEGSNCEYVTSPADVIVVATKSLGGPHRDARTELLVTSYGNGDFTHPKGPPWRLWRFTGIIVEWVQLTVGSAIHLESLQASLVGVATSLQSSRLTEHARIVKVGYRFHIHTYHTGLVVASSAPVCIIAIAQMEENLITLYLLLHC